MLPAEVACPAAERAACSAAMTIDLEAVRRDTPGVQSVLHLNNAGAALSPRPVVEAVVGHLQLEARIGGYEAADQARGQIERTYQAIAALLGASPGEIALVDSATRAWDIAFYGLRLGPGDRILTGRAEYASNYIAFLHRAQRSGVRIEVVPDDEHGQLSVAALEQRIDRDVKLIAITHVPTNGGLVNPAAAVGQIARAAGIPFLLDACQSAGQLPLDVETLGCDFLSATGRKYLRGPRGTGFLYVREPALALLEPPFLDLHGATWTGTDSFELRGDARRFETWESYVAGTIGLGVAVDYALSLGLTSIRDRIRQLAALLRDQLAALPGVQVHDQGQERCGIVTFTCRDRSALELQQALRARSINVSVSVAAYGRLNMDPRGLAQLLRASVHYYNSEAELERFGAALRELLA
jgi:selenocysteine lyase/cysteine desulfurase